MKHLAPDITQVAVFDTAFFTTLPEIAQTYAIPHALAQKYALRRYGFHGLAHQAMWRRWWNRNLKPDSSTLDADQVPDGRIKDHFDAARRGLLDYGD